MKAVNFKRRAAMHFAWVAVVAAAGFSQKASAEIANPGLVPSKSAYVLSIPDAPAFWNAWKANSLYATWQKFESMPDIKKKMDKFSKELNVIEASLGYKIDGETFSAIFKDGVIYVLGGDEKEPVLGAAFTVSDKDKLNKLIDLIKKAAVENANNAKDDDSEDESDKKDEKKEEKKADEKKPAVTEKDIIHTEEYNGVTLTGFKKDADEKDLKDLLFYAEVDGKLLVTNGLANAKALVDRAKNATPGADTVAGDENFKKIVAELAGKKGQAYVYGNQAEAYNLQKDDKTSTVARELTKKFTSQNYFGASVSIEPKEIYSYAVGILDPNDKESLVAKYPGDKELGITGLVPAETLFTVNAGLFDAKLIYDAIEQIAKTEDKNLGEETKKFEEQVGFSIKDDLIPALGNEVGLSLNKVDMSQGLPDVQSVLAIKVGDKAKMDKVLGAVEKLATDALKSKGEDTKLQEEKLDNNTYKYLEIPSPVKLTPGVLTGGEYVLIGSSIEGIKSALAAQKDGKNISTNETVKALAPRISTKANVFQFWNFDGIHKLVTLGVGMSPIAKDAMPYVELFKVLKTSAASSHVENGKVISESVLLLN